MNETSKLVIPIKLATIYLSESDGPYLMEIRYDVINGGDWAYFYKDTKRVWECNATFARHHFVEVGYEYLREKYTYTYIN
jgi:hypothetical protein